MIPPNAYAPLVHGGDLDAARRLFPGAPEPFLDLSTGINPNAYPIPALPPHIFARLPQADELARLKECAASAYGAPSESNVVPACGTQSLMTLIAGTAAPGLARVVGPTYAEHARALSLAGREVEMVRELAPLGEAALGVVVNPNNPDGRVFAQEDLLSVAERLHGSGGLLVVDEAFMDVGPREESLAGVVDQTSVIVLRSFGKAFGLAGLRLSFALAASGTAERLRAALGPWPVSGPALAAGARALSDTQWMDETRTALAKASQRLDQLLENAGLQRVGGTSLFTLVKHEDAPQVFSRLGRAGIIVRRFADEPTWLRFGLPGNEADWQRLKAALCDK
jgi:cobalamin biosynthetic protein CobC